MTEPSSSEDKREGDVCYWCGVTFQPQVWRRRPVCPRCYRLLTGAGIKDEEIFGEGSYADKGGGEKEAADD
jgi:protein-arginine kinase activator protein McsA